MKNRLLLLLSGVLLLSGFTVVAQKTKTSRKLVWSDEFDKPGLPDPAKWGYEEGMPRGVQRQYYTSNRAENAKVENGFLVITAKKEKYTNPKFKKEALKSTAYPEAYNRMSADSIPANIRVKYDSVIHYTSASINTKAKASWKYGRIEVRAKLPAGKGSSCAIWMLSDGNPEIKWPVSGEIDIVEALGRTPDRVSSAVHYGGSNKEHLQDAKVLKVPGSTTDFHIYAIEWNAQIIDFYCDGNRYHSFAINKAIPADCFQQSFYLIMNIALGSGSWSGPVDDKSLPQQMLIDYVRVYQ